jgi:colanic acid biosynthesis glycosyl transferase WcaI
VRILLVTLVFSPDGVSTAALMTELAVELQRLGHDVTVVTTTPHYNHEPEAVERQPLKRRWAGLLYESSIGTIPVYHAKVAKKGSRVLSRVFDYARFHAVGSLAPLLKSRRFDVVIAPTPPLTIGLHARLLARITGAKFIYNVQEIYPDVAVRLGVLKQNRVAALLDRMERRTYQRADAVVVISEHFRRTLLAKGVPPGKLAVIPNFVDTEFLCPRPRHNPLSQRHDLDDKFVVLYSGNLGLTQDFESVLEAAADLSDLADLRFVIAGNGARTDWLKDEIRVRGQPNVLLLPYQPRSEVPDLYAACDVGIIPLRRDGARDTFPSKVYSIMASGRPVVAAAEPDTELAAVIAEADAGTLVSPERPAELAGTIRRLYDDRASAQRMGQNGREFVVATHGRKAVCRQYDILIRALCPDG